VVRRAALALALAAGAFAPSAASADDPGCVVQPANGAAVTVIGQGANSRDIVCRYVATGRGGVTASTPNPWRAVNLTTGQLVADSSGLPVWSTWETVRPGDTVEVTMFERFDPVTATLRTDGVIRVGGPGVVPQS
jgi:hypothetical protein